MAPSSKGTDVSGLADQSAGHHEIVIVCEGTGTVRVDLLTNVDLRAEIPCDGHPYTIGYDQAADVEASVAFTPDMAAFGHSSTGLGEQAGTS